MKNVEHVSSSEKELVHNLPNPSSKGYSLWLAAVYITSFMAGMGVLAMPHALAGTGWFGVILVCLACANSWYSSTILGRSWLILEERWGEYRGKFRYPYPAIGMRATGRPWMRYVVSVALHVSFIGISIVYLLLSAEIAESLTNNYITLEYKYWIIILAAILCPLSWFGSIEEFWFAAIGALATATLACVAILVAVLLQVPKETLPTYGDTSFSTASLAFGAILFSFGGAFMCPTIQNDMADRRKFHKAALIGFIGILLLYLPVTVVGYAVVGHSVPPNILDAIGKGTLRTVIEACLAIHVFLAFLLAVNPVAQELEESLNVKPTFNWKRLVIRSLIVGLNLVVAYAVPHFDKILNLIGGSTFTLLAFVFPPIFYMLLVRGEPLESEAREISVLEKLFLIQVVITGVAGGISCTYFAILDIAQAIS
ncbi:hypothetical protein JTE90_006151 [Oedothorax gibbosus]|uniref:Amino acid transporter transmembrane domain-containing protein n=1 Tax=Oedothorax gibbosus TaxID=931172 RepID=A0AAV6U6G0_9ARAC|nr:hypothetical protein JTE90_006151 [Oedothorax gibbosus]